MKQIANKVIRLRLMAYYDQGDNLSGTRWDEFTLVVNQKGVEIVNY